MMKRMGGLPGGMGNAMTFGKSGAKVYVEEASTGVSFADVAGQDEAKESLMEVVDFLHGPEKYAAIGARLPKGVLLVGVKAKLVEPGGIERSTGKTQARRRFEKVEGSAWKPPRRPLPWWGGSLLRRRGGCMRGTCSRR